MYRSVQDPIVSLAYVAGGDRAGPARLRGGQRAVLLTDPAGQAAQHARHVSAGAGWTPGSGWAGPSEEFVAAGVPQARRGARLTEEFIELPEGDLAGRDGGLRRRVLPDAAGPGRAAAGPAAAPAAAARRRRRARAAPGRPARRRLDQRQPARPAHRSAQDIAAIKQAAEQAGRDPDGCGSSCAASSTCRHRAVDADRTDRGRAATAAARQRRADPAGPGRPGRAGRRPRCSWT